MERGVLIIHLHRISGGKKNMIKKGKKWRRKKTGGGGGEVYLAGFELGTVVL